MTLGYLFIVVLAVVNVCNGVATLPLSDLRTRVGLNIHLTWNRDAYATANFTQALVAMGGGLLRDSAVTVSNITRDWSEIKTLYAAGYRFNVIVTTDQTAADFVSMAVAMHSALPGIIYTLELPNEMNTPPLGQPNGQNGFTYNGKNSTHDPSVFAAVALDYYAAIKANAVLKDLPVLCPTVSIGYAGWQQYIQNATNDANGKKMCDWGNIHPYSNNDGQALPNILIHEETVASVEAPGSPWAITEIGMSAYTTTARQATGKHLLNAIFDTFYESGQFVILYDAFRDTNSTTDQAHEANFGIMEYNGTVLPSGQVMKNYFSIVRDNGTYPDSLSSLNISFSGVANVSFLQFQHSNTHMFIMVSAEIPFWNGTAFYNTALRPLTVHLPTGVTLYNVFDPYVSDQPVVSPNAVSQYTIASFSDHPIFIETSAPSTTSSSSSSASTASTASTSSQSSTTSSPPSTIASSSSSAPSSSSSSSSSTASSSSLPSSSSTTYSPSSSTTTTGGDVSYATRVESFVLWSLVVVFLLF